MKAAIVTFIRAYNHGAVLQCFALQHALEKIGIDSEVIDYNPQYFQAQYNLHYLGKLRYFPYRPLKNWAKYTPMYWVLNKRNRGFSNFIKKHIKLSKDQYYTISDLDSPNLDYASYIAGSDQVWSPFCANFDPVFFLDFKAANSKKKYSYAASFGTDKIPEHLLAEYYKRLKNYSYISVREPSAISLAEKILGTTPSLCCDPTLLFDQHDWMKLLPIRRRKKGGPYILVYTVHPTIDILPLVTELKNTLNIKAYSITSISTYEGLMGKKCKSLDITHIGSASPLDFLELFLNAEYIITDSFHGTVFSILFHKNFRTLTVHPSGYINSRADTLLRELDLQSCAISFSDYNFDPLKIDWKKVDSELSSKREKSLNYLHSLDI